MKKRIFRTRQKANRNTFLRSKSGAILILTAMMLPLLLGLAGLAIQIGIGYSTKRYSQVAADTIAIAGATEITNPGFKGSSLQTRAQTEATANNITSGNGYTMTVNNPPTSGSYTKDSSAVEVIIKKTVSLGFSNYFVPSVSTITARAVAKAQSSPICVMTYEPSASGSISMSGSSALNATNCSIAISSTSTSPISKSSTNTVNTDLLLLAGGYSPSPATAVNAKNGVRTNFTPPADSFSGIAIPSYSGCTATNLSITTSTTLSPGVYCGGIAASGGSATVTLNPGTYILDGGKFSLGSGATMTGTGVTLILTSSSKTSYPSFSIAGNSSLNISAPTSGTLAGIAIFQDPATPASTTATMGGSVASNITGAVYFPTQTLSMSGSANASSCMQIFAKKLTMAGSANAGISCSGSYPTFASTYKITLVE